MFTFAQNLEYVTRVLYVGCSQERLRLTFKHVEVLICKGNKVKGSLYQNGENYENICNTVTNVISKIRKHMIV